MVHPVQPAVVQQQLVMNGANTSAVSVFSPPNFPTIHQALLGAARTGDQQPQSTVTTTSAAATATVAASVVPDPAVIKTLLASKLARNLTHQQQSEVTSSQGTTSVPSVPSSTSVTSASVSDGSLPSPASSTVATSAADIVGAAQENHVSVSSTSPVVSVSVTSPVGKVENAVDTAGSEKTDVAVESNGLTDTVSVSLTSSCSVSGTVAPSLCLANGHTKPFHDPSALMNGICSPVPSCSSEDQEPLHDVKVPKSLGYSSECDGLVVNGDVLDNEADDVDDDDDDDDVSDLNDCDGDVLVKAMMHADIIDCGGHPANDCDDDSHASADLSQFIESTQEPVSSSPDIGASDRVSGTEAGIGFDSETAAAVADLLHETGMMADDEAAVSNMSATADDNCMSFDDGDDGATADSQCIIEATCDALSVPADDTLTSAAVDDSSVSALVFDQQLGCQSTTADDTEQLHVAVSEGTEPPLLTSACVGLVTTSSNTIESAVAESACSANTVGAGLPQMSSSLMPTQLSVNSVPAAAQLQNGVMVVPPHGISLPSGQFISGGTRLLIRPIASVPQAANSTPSMSVRLAQSTLPPAIQPALTAQTAGTVTGTSSPTVVDGNSQFPSCSVTVSSSAPAVRFVSSTTSQGQLIIQRTQMFTSTSSPLIQRVIVPQTARPIAMRSEGQMILPATQPNQQMASRPVLLTQAPFPASQLRVAGPGMQLMAGSNTHHPQQSPAQIVLQSGHVISVQPQQPSTQDITQPNQSSANLPVLTPKPQSDQQQNQSASLQTTRDGSVSASNQPVVQAAGPQLSTGVQPSLRPLMSTSQQPVQIVGGPMQLRAGLVGLPAGAGNASVILQHGGRPILLQSPNVGSAQRPSSYVVFRPGTLPVQSSQEPINNIAVSSAALASSSSSSLASDVTSRKRPITPSSATVTRSLRKKTKKDDDCGQPFMCEWSGCQRYMPLYLLFALLYKN